MNATKKETSGHRETSQRGVPKGVIDAAEADFRKAREVARVANERYWRIRDHVTQLRARRAAYEARQQVTREESCRLQVAGCNPQRATRNGVGVGLRNAQGQRRAIAAGQIRKRAGYRGDTAAGEPGTASEV